MYLDLTDVLRVPGNSVEKSIEIEPVTLEDIQITAPVLGVVRAANARQSIVVDGSASTAVQLICARCLQPYPQPLELELEAVAPLGYFRGLMGVVDPEEVEADDEIAALFDAHSLDVLELVRQSVVLQSPIKPLCSDDCPGMPEAAQYLTTGLTGETGQDERGILNGSA